MGSDGGGCGAGAWDAPAATGGGGAGSCGFGLLEPHAAVKAVAQITPAAATVGSHARFVMRGSPKILTFRWGKKDSILGRDGQPNPNPLNRKRETAAEIHLGHSAMTKR